MAMVSAAALWAGLRSQHLYSSAASVISPPGRVLFGARIGSDAGIRVRVFSFTATEIGLVSMAGEYAARHKIFAVAPMIDWTDLSVFCIYNNAV